MGLEDFYSKLAPRGLDPKRIARASAKIYLKLLPLTGPLEEFKGRPLVLLSDEEAEGYARAVYLSSEFLLVEAFREYFRDTLRRPVRLWAYPELDLEGLVRALVEDEDESIEYVKYLKRSDTGYYLPLIFSYLARQLHGRDVAIVAREGELRAYEVETVKGDCFKLSPLRKEVGDVEVEVFLRRGK